LLKGLPSVDLYPALLDGGWSAHRWRSVSARISEATAPVALLAEDVGPMSFRSQAASHMGRVRGNNEDGFVDRPEAGIWAVADGMGGHSHGEVASRMVCDALTDVQLDGTFEEAIDAARIRVQQVNDHLVRAGSLDPSRQSGSTVVVLLTRGARSAILWAGDSRAYRWREGTLEQLTSDHSLAAELAGTVPAESSVITRAVGIEGDLVLDVHRDVVRAADRFLLCSDGLTRAVPETTICAWMHAPSIQAAVEGLIQATLDAGAPDNVTVLIAEAHQ
jgi:serine/threonine protein phosphatase PrpC